MYKMKDSGVDWIGSIPNDWEINNIGALFKVRNEKVNDTDYPPLSVSKGGIVPQMENVAKSDANDNRKLVLKNDFVINSRSDRKQSCGVSKLDGSVSLINTVLYANKQSNLLPKYPNYLMKNYGFAEEFYRWGHGIVADLWTTRWQEMKNIQLPVPPTEEQQKIYNRINIDSQKIDKLIKTQEQQIEKLKQYKQSFITEVVTKGIDQSVPMKDSYIEWIGKIPYSWGVSRIGRMCFVTKLAGFEFTNSMMNAIDVEGDVPIVRAQNIKMGRFIDNINVFIPLNVSLELDRCCLDRKCLLMTFIGAGIGEVAIFDKEKRYHLAPNVAKIVITEKYKEIIEDKYLMYFLMSSAGQEEVNKIKKSTAQPSLSMETIRSISFVLPSMKEQEKIIRVLDKNCSKIDKLINIKQNKIDKLNEYKKSLIYEYVTGKKEVDVAM